MVAAASWPGAAGPGDTVPRGVHGLLPLRLLLTQAAAARGAGGHVGVLSTTPAPAPQGDGVCAVF